MSQCRDDAAGTDRAITIRRARLDEADLLTDLSMRSKRSNGYDDAFMEACREELAITRQSLLEGEYWVAECDGVCGCVCLLADRNGQAGEVHAFFVDPDRQRRGIGRLLWHRLLESAEEKGLVELRLDADPFAVPFYRKLGFATIGEVASGSIEGRTIPHMRRIIRERG